MNNHGVYVGILSKRPNNQSLMYLAVINELLALVTKSKGYQKNLFTISLEKGGDRTHALSNYGPDILCFHSVT